MCRWAVCSINSIRTSESGTLLPISFNRSSRATLSAVSAVHSLVKASKTTLKHQNSLKSLFELQQESTSASLSCLRGYYSNMAQRKGLFAFGFFERYLCEWGLVAKVSGCHVWPYTYAWKKPDKLNNPKRTKRNNQNEKKGGKNVTVSKNDKNRLRNVMGSFAISTL